MPAGQLQLFSCIYALAEKTALCKKIISASEANNTVHTYSYYKAGAHTVTEICADWKY